MHTFFIVIAVVVIVVAVWLYLVADWMKKQSLIGSWVAVLEEGTQVTMRFEGEQSGGVYRQLTVRDDASMREFGHWSVNLSELRFIVMASDREDHPRLGLETLCWVSWQSADRMTIDGPDRPKWVFDRAVDGVEIDFNPGALVESTIERPEGGR